MSFRWFEISCWDYKWCWTSGVVPEELHVEHVRRQRAAASRLFKRKNINHYFYSLKTTKT